MTFSRRDFVKTSVLGAVAAGVGARAQGEESNQGAATQEHDSQSGSYKRPIIICANNGFNYLDDAYVFLKSGGDTLDAALKVVKGPE
ncbi:MAG: twin-arginine translocation signal domain-containing protein, partial [Candidatus Sulfotelmatobacter sp.]